MEAKSLKNIIQRNKNTRADQHIPGIAVFLFVVILIGMIKVVTLLQAMNASDLMVTAVILAMTVIAMYILFALKVASQWQKAVVLRLASSFIPRPRPFLDRANCRYHPNLDR